MVLADAVVMPDGCLRPEGSAAGSQKTKGKDWKPPDAILQLEVTTRNHKDSTQGPLTPGGWRMLRGGANDTEGNQSNLSGR